MDAKQLYLLVEDFFGYKVKMQYMNSEKKRSEEYYMVHFF